MMRYDMRMFNVSSKTDECSVLVYRKLKTKKMMKHVEQANAVKLS